MTDPEPTADRSRRTGTWPLIRAERAALAADLVDLTDDQWATPSLCSELTVREVLAHFTAAASLNSVRWLAGVLRCRFDFDKQLAMRLAEQLGATPAETLERFRRVVPSTTKPPLPVMAMLGETVVHGEDIRRPLGIRRDYPIETVTQVVEYYRGSDLVVAAKGRIGGLGLVANDGPFVAGSGPLVSGTTLALVMAVTGRSSYCDDLEATALGFSAAAAGGRDSGPARGCVGTDAWPGSQARRRRPMLRHGRNGQVTVAARQASEYLPMVRCGRRPFQSLGRPHPPHHP